MIDRGSSSRTTSIECHPGTSCTTKRVRMAASLFVVATRLALSSFVLASEALSPNNSHRSRKLESLSKWKDHFFAQKDEGMTALLNVGDVSNLNATTPDATWPTPVVSSPSSTLAPTLALLNIPSLNAKLAGTSEPTDFAVPTPALPAVPPVAASGPPFPLAPIPVAPTTISPPVPVGADHSTASPSENIDYGYNFPPTSGPMSIMPVIVISPTTTRNADAPSTTESPTAPSMDLPSDQPSDVPSGAPTDLPSAVPTVPRRTRLGPLLNASKIVEDPEQPRSPPPKSITTLISGTAKTTASLYKSAAKAKANAKSKSKQSKCRGVPKASKAPSSLTKSPTLLTMSPALLSKSPSSKSKAPHYCPPTFSPYPTITEGPTVTAPPSTLSDVILSVSCESVKQGQGPITGPAQSYTVDFILIISDSVNATMQRLQDFLQTVVAANMAGCVTDESTNVTNVVFDVYEDPDLPACATDVSGTSCHHLKTDATVYYKDNEVKKYSADDFRKFLLRFCDDFKNLPGVEQTFDPCSAMDVTDNGPAVAASQASRSAPMNNVSVGGLVGVVLAALFLILVVLFAARRKQKGNYAQKHHPLEEYDDSTYLKDDFEATSVGSKRRAHVVNEEDSIFSGLSSYGAGTAGRRGLDPPPSSSLLMATRPHQQDVHVCTSATCDVCEQRRRQSGLQFIPAVMPSHSSDSLSRPRSFVAQDTVQL